MFDALIVFFQNYFVDPIIYGSGYNVYNTVVYAILFALVAFGTYKLLKYYHIEINTHFLIGVTPYIILGSILRVLQDAGITQTYLFVTPLIYFIILIIALDLLAVSRIIRRVQDKSIKDYWKTWGLLGAGLCLIALIPFTFTNAYGFLLIVGVFIIWAAVFLGIKKYIRVKWIQKLFSMENIWITLAHVFDATTTFVSLQFFAYSEQHVLAGAVIDSVGPAGMFLLKIPVILLVLYVLDKELPDRVTGFLTKNPNEERTFIKLAILLLGLGPGLRNALRLIVGV